jgi:hypothetical protein
MKYSVEGVYQSATLMADVCGFEFKAVTGDRVEGAFFDDVGLVIREGCRDRRWCSTLRIYQSTRKRGLWRIG